MPSAARPRDLGTRPTPTYPSSSHLRATAMAERVESLDAHPPSLLSWRTLVDGGLRPVFPVGTTNGRTRAFEEALTNGLPAIGAMMMGMMMPASRMIGGGGARESARMRR